MSVVVIVPSFAESQQRHPPTVARILAGLEALLAPEVRRRVDEPGRVQADGDAKENPPHHHAPPAEIEERKSQDDEWHKVEAIEPDMEAIFHQVGSVAQEHRIFVLLRGALKNPSDV